MAANKLSANDDKTHILVVRKDNEHPEKFSFEAGNCTITEKSSEKLLGMTVSNDFKMVRPPVKACGLPQATALHTETD